MVKNDKKIWVNCERLKWIVGYYITLFFIVPILSMGFSSLAHSETIDMGIPNAIKVALLNGLQWGAIIMLVITVAFAIWFFFNTDTVIFSDSTINYYRYFFSKNALKIYYNEITECVFNDGLWKHNGRYVIGRVVLIYNKNELLLKLSLYYKLCHIIAVVLADKKIGLVDEDCKIRTLDNYFKVDFLALSSEQQAQILKYYCKLVRGKYRTAEEILGMKRSKKSK